MSLLRLVLIGEILRADEVLLVLLADVMQQSGLLDRSQKPQASKGQRQKGTVHTLGSGAVRSPRSSKRRGATRPPTRDKSPEA
jgi:hypothetical protein